MANMLASFAADAPEINLILKAKEPGDDCELIEVLYMPNRTQVGVHFCSDGDWTELPPFKVTLKAHTRKAELDPAVEQEQEQNDHD